MNNRTRHRYESDAGSSPDVGKQSRQARRFSNVGILLKLIGLVRSRNSVSMKEQKLRTRRRRGLGFLGLVLTPIVFLLDLVAGIPGFFEITLVWVGGCIIFLLFDLCYPSDASASGEPNNEDLVIDVE